MLVYLDARPELQRLCRYLLDLDDDPSSAISVLGAASICTLAPVPSDIAERAICRLEAVLPQVNESARHYFLDALGCLLYRAGRPAEAIRAFDDAIRRRGKDEPEDLAFLAMAHQPLGHAAEARDWLARFESRLGQATHPTYFWQAIPLDILRREAEARIRFDPAFPADPFAHPARRP